MDAEPPWAPRTPGDALRERFKAGYVPDTSRPMTGERLKWCLFWIGWSPRQMSSWLNVHRDVIKKMCAEKRNIPYQLADWVEGLADFHFQNPLHIGSLPEDDVWDDEDVIDLTAGEQVPIGERPMLLPSLKARLQEIGWTRKAFRVHSHLGVDRADRIFAGEEIVNDSTADWLELLAAFHRDYPRYPTGWRAAR